MTHTPEGRENGCHLVGEYSLASVSSDMGVVTDDVPLNYLIYPEVGGLGAGEVRGSVHEDLWGSDVRANRLGELLTVSTPNATW